MRAFAFNLVCEIISSDWYIIGVIETCHTHNANITMQDQNITGVLSVSNQTTENFTGDDVKGLITRFQTVKYMPKGLDKFFSNLQGIWIQHSKLTAIEKSDFETLPNLKFIYLGYNELTTLNSDLFSYNVELLYVNMINNSLTSVEDKTFDKLTKLEHLDFSYNPCINERAFSKAEVRELLADLSHKCPTPTRSNSTNNRKHHKTFHSITSTRKYSNTRFIKT